MAVTPVRNAEFRGVAKDDFDQAMRFLSRVGLHNGCFSAIPVRELSKRAEFLIWMGFGGQITRSPGSVESTQFQWLWAKREQRLFLNTNSGCFVGSRTWNVLRGYAIRRV